MHVIAYYSFTIKGSSSERLIREMIVPVQGDDPFSSLESMERALEAKRNKLNNLRVFEEVSYSYEKIHQDEQAIRYRVKFVIDDAFSFLAIPYPKYDSNYGLRIGLKAYDKNLFGSFADLYFVVNATQVDSSWEQWKWYSELEITDIPAGDSRFDVAGEFEAVQDSEGLSDIVYTGKIDWRDISFAQTGIDFHVILDDYTTTTANKLDKLLTTSLDWKNLPWLKDQKLHIRPAMQFLQDAPDAPWEVDNASFYFSVSPFKINGEHYTLSQTVKLKFPHEYVYGDTRLSLPATKFLGMSYSFWLRSTNYYHLDNQNFYDNTYTVGNSLGFSLPFRGSYKGSYEVSLRDRFDPTYSNLNLVPVVSTTQTLSFGSVNWKGNFRSGLKTSFRGDAKYALFSRDYQNMDYLNYQVQAELESYLALGSRLGLSGRVLGFYSHVPSFDWYKNQAFPEFLPNKETSASEALRGILDDTYESIVGADDYQKLGAVANIDATLMFIKFKGFAEGFMSVFMDVGVFTLTYPEGAGDNDITQDDLIILKTVGVEGYGIMDKFPSYPIRGSLGFNLDDVMRHIRGEIAFSQIEFELSIGMGLHY
jgi:hypothetical protein